MSINEPTAKIATETTESPRSRPLLSADDYFARQPRPRVEYGTLVAAVADQLEIDAAEAKRHISDIGRRVAEDRFYSDQRFTGGSL